MRRNSDCSCRGQPSHDFEFDFEFDEMEYEKTPPKPPAKSGTKMGGAVMPGLSGATPMVRFACLWNFPFEGTVMPGEHADLITRIAHGPILAIESHARTLQPAFGGRRARR